MLVVADALAIANPASAEEIDLLLGTDDVDGVVEAFLRLQRRGVIVVEETVARPVGALDDLLHRPLGLGPSFVDLVDHVAPDVLEELARSLAVEGANKRSTTARAIAARLREPATLTRLLESSPTNTAELLDALVEKRSPAVGLPAGYLYRSMHLDDPLAWMLGQGILIAVSDGLAELPREIVMAARPNGLAPGAMLRPIDVRPVAGLDAQAVNAAGADQASRCLEGAEGILRMAGDGQIAVRKTGGVGVREVRRVAKLLDLDARDAGRLIELLYHARLINPVGSGLVATELAQTWWALSRSRRWLVLVRSWVVSPSFLSRALSDDGDGGTQPALGEVEPVAVAEAGRQVVLDLVATLEPGQAYDPDQLTEAVVWRSPNLWGAGEPDPGTLVEWTFAEAALLGLTAVEGLTPALAALVADDQAELEVAAEATLGVDQSQFVLQSDLTAVALGPLEPVVAGRLAEMADRRSGLSIPTYRFTEGSIRRGLDRGWSAEAIEQFLVDHALSGLPQPLQYLLADVDRRYGTVRVLAASSVIVTTDEAAAVEIASTTRAARLGLRLVAPTVLVGPVEPHRMVEELRAEGLFPVLDGATVTVGIRRPTDGLDARPDTLLQGETGLPADWTGPALSEAALPGEVADAVAAMQADEAIACTDSDRDHRLHLLWNRRAVIRHLRHGELIETRGILVGIDESLTLLNDSGIEELPLDSVVAVEDPSR